MCEPTTIALGVAAISAASTVAGGIAAKNSADQQAANLEITARQNLQAANVEANQARAKASRELGGVRATQSARGVDLSSGSAADVGGLIAQNNEMDALMTLYKGQLGSWQNKYAAKVARSEGKAKLIESGLKAGTTLLSAGSNAGFFSPSAPAASSIAPLPLKLGYTPSAYG